MQRVVSSSRPLVGLFRWATTPSSILLGVAGLILLKKDRQLHPMASPIIDSYDLLSRLRKHLSTNTNEDWKCSTIDFSAMYTRVTWEHTLHTYNYWKNVFYNCDRSTLHISKVELAFLDFVFTPINQFACMNWVVTSLTSSYSAMPRPLVSLYCILYIRRPYS